MSVDLCWSTFEASLRQVFANWTLLRLATDQSWGGRNSSRKAENLINSVLDLFRGAAFKKNGSVDAFDLSEYLEQQIEELFSAEADDDSPAEVSELLVNLFRTCGKGDFTLVNQIQSQIKIDLQVSKGDVNSSDSEIDDDGQEDPMKLENHPKKKEITNEDGWTFVQKK